MEIKKGDKSFIIQELPDNNVWIRRENGEAGSFNSKNLASALYDAIDKFFRENF